MTQETGELDSLVRKRIRIETNQAAEFPTMLPHAIGAEGGPCEIIGVFDRDARRGHQRGDDATKPGTPARDGS